MLDQTTEKNVSAWLKGQYDPETKQAIQTLLEKNPKQLEDAFYRHLSFGTGGMRGVMGIGTNRMNRYTIAFATQGFANYLKQHHSQKSDLSIFISYDSRQNSKAFSGEAAKVLAGNGIRVYLTKDLRPTPLVSFGCRYKQCQGAIMITASHNPPEYNGYKVYWSDGGQVTPPHDKAIVKEANNITDLTQIQTVASLDHPLIEQVTIDNAYFQATHSLQLYPDQNQKEGKDLSITYTSLHGTGITLIPEMLKKWGFTTLHLVEKQVIPDGNFPTCNPPNPEDPKALELGIKTMQQTNSDLLIATDPDADRIGVVVNHHGSPKILNGNQMACLLLNHVLDEKKSTKGACVKTIVTTELFAAIANHFHCKCFNVLTGFKYIAELIHKWETENSYEYLFGGEESYGYLFGTHARDKDAVICAALIAEMALKAKKEGKTLIDKLHDLYRQFGVYLEKVISIQFPETKEGTQARENAMNQLQNNPPKSINGATVISIDNYQTSIKKDLQSGKEEKLTLPKSPVLIFWLSDDSKLIVRPSGTEPKIKLYCGVKENVEESVEKTLEKCEQKINKFLGEVKTLL